MKVNYQTTLIVVAMVLGIAAGYVCNSLISPEAATEAASYFAMVTDIFLRLVKMIIAPLVFSTLVAGLAGSWGIRALRPWGALPSPRPSPQFPDRFPCRNPS